MPRKLLSILLLALVFANVSLAQQTTPPAPPTVGGGSGSGGSVVQPVFVSDVLAYPGPVLSPTVGQVVQIQFEAVMTDGKKTRNLFGLPLAFRLLPGSTALSGSCILDTGKCTLVSKTPGAVSVQVVDSRNGNIYSGSRTRVTLDFVPDTTNTSGTFGKDELVVVPTSQQVLERESFSLVVTMPRDYVGPHTLNVSGSGDSHYIFFPQGLRRGQRVQILDGELLPEESGNRYANVSLTNDFGKEVAYGFGEIDVRTGFKKLEASINDRNDLTIFVPGGLNRAFASNITLLRGDGFSLPISNVIRYETEKGTQLVLYDSTLGFTAELPPGFYSVDVVASYPEGGYSTITQRDGLYLQDTITLH